MLSVFIPTNSADATSDELVRIFSEQGVNVFRWNVDLWTAYEVTVADRTISIADPTGRSIDLGAENVFMLWRKPFVDLMCFEGLPLSEPDWAYARSQLRQLLYAISGLMMPGGRVRLVEPDADRRLPKLLQLIKAQSFFETPRYLLSVRQPPVPFGPKVVTKALGSPEVGYKILYTTATNADDLVRPFPWFLQEPLTGGTDVTVVHILGSNFFYECSFKRDEDNVDWRTEINSENQSAWHTLDSHIVDELGRTTSAFMKKLGLHYGRLDFIRKGDSFYFLECNTNGQFGWLDDPANSYLHHRVVDAALNAESRVC